MPTNVHPRPKASQADGQPKSMTVGARARTVPRRTWPARSMTMPTIAQPDTPRPCPSAVSGPLAAPASAAISAISHAAWPPTASAMAAPPTRRPAASLPTAHAPTTATNPVMTAAIAGTRTSNVYPGQSGGAGWVTIHVPMSVQIPPASNAAAGGTRDGLCSRASAAPLTRSTAPRRLRPASSRTCWTSGS